MDFISAIEDAIIDRLLAKTSKRVLVQSYPDDPETWEPTHGIGALLVRYTEGNYGDTMDTGLVVQDREMLFEVTMAMWSLRGKQGGIYNYMEAVRVALSGFTPPNCTRKLTPVGEGYVGRGTGLKSKSRRLWQYQITFRTETMNIEVAEVEQVPLLVKLTTIDETLNITTEVP